MVNISLMLWLIFGVTMQFMCWVIENPSWRGLITRIGD